MRNLYTKIKGNVRRYVTLAGLIGAVGFGGLESRLYSKDIFVPRNYATIQSAIDASEEGDVILVADGTYKGLGNRDIDFLGKRITVRSENGPESCIIDCEGTYNEPYRGFLFHSGEDENSVLDGFTIINGYVFKCVTPCDIGPGGGGIRCEGASPTIMRNIIKKNLGLVGGGITCINSSAIIRNNQIVENYPMIQPSNWGGGIFCQFSKPTIKDNIIMWNAAESHGGGLVLMNCPEGNIENNIIAGNLVTDGNGGGIYCRDSSIVATNNTITGNYCSDNGFEISGGSGIMIIKSIVTIMNSIIWNNADSTQIVTAKGGYEGGLNPIEPGDVNLTIHYSNVEGDYEGIGNINLNPLFVNHGRWDGWPFPLWSDGNLHLQLNSPCIDTGDPNSPLDPDGTRADIGALFYDQRIQQNPSIRLEEIVTSTCNPAFVRVFLTNYCSVEAFSFGLTYDPLVIKAVVCNPSGATALLNEGKGPEFWHYSLNPLSECNDGRAGVIVGMVGSLTNPAGSTIARHINQEIATLIYNTVPGVSEGRESSLDFVECLRPAKNTPLTPCIITCNSSSIKPVKISGRAYISGNCFKRGDCNCDSYFDISDAVSILNYLYNESSVPKPPCCFDACDANDDGKLDVSDGIRMLGRLFIGSEELPDPYKNCGNDPALDDLTCSSYDFCNNRVVDRGY